MLSWSELGQLPGRARPQRLEIRSYGHPRDADRRQARAGDPNHLKQKQMIQTISSKSRWSNPSQARVATQSKVLTAMPKSNPKEIRIRVDPNHLKQEQVIQTISSKRVWSKPSQAKSGDPNHLKQEQVIQTPRGWRCCSGSLCGAVVPKENIKKLKNSWKRRY